MRLEGGDGVGLGLSIVRSVAEGKIRWVLVDGNTGMGPQDGRTGATTVMDWVQSHGEKVTSSGLYDLSATSQVSS